MLTLTLATMVFAVAMLYLAVAALFYMRLAASAVPEPEEVGDTMVLHLFPRTDERLAA